VAELTALGFDYWALGHVHKRQVHSEAPWVVMPGMPQGRDIGEAGAKSATLLTVDAGKLKVREVPTSVVTFLAHDIDLTGAEEDDTIRQRLRAGLRAPLAELAPGSEAILRLTFTGRTARHWQVLRDRDVWSETAQRMAEETGRLWIEKLRFDLDAPKGETKPAGETGAAEEVARLMAEIAAEAGFVAQAQAEVEEVLSQLPPARRAALLGDEAALARLTQELCTAGSERLFALMKGASE
jgi:DNA repair exonuclease SbcCD nuclease subunit